MRSPDVEELLTEEMRAQAGRAAWRPELLQKAMRARRRRQARRRVLVPAVAAGVAAVVAVSVATAVPGRGGAAAGRPQVVTAAYVLSHARSAVAAAGRDVLETQSHVSNGSSFTQWFESGPTDQYRVDIYPPAGRPQYLFADASRTLALEFQTGTWWAVHFSPGERRFLRRTHSLLLGPPLPFVMPSLGLGYGPPTPENIRKELANGTFRLVGSDTVGGTRLLHLRGDAPLDRTDLSVNVWVDAHSYLPVRSSVRERTPSGSLLTSSQFAWLPATPANLALFTPHIPAGFTYRAP